VFLTFNKNIQKRDIYNKLAYFGVPKIEVETTGKIVFKKRYF